MTQVGGTLCTHGRVNASLDSESQLSQCDRRSESGFLTDGLDHGTAINVTGGDPDPNAAIEDHAHGSRTVSSNAPWLSLIQACACFGAIISRNPASA